MLLAVQLSLIQSLAFVQGHHLAYVVVSVALLGFGAGGSLLTLMRKVAPDKLAAWYAPCASLAGASVAWLPRMTQEMLQGLEVDLLFTGITPWVQLAVLGLVLFVPFCFGALALSIVFRVLSDRIAGVYAANLTGSAIGAAVVIPLLTYLLPEALLPLLGLLGAASGILFSRRPVWLHGTMLVLIVFAIVTSSAWQPSQYRDLAYALQLPGHTAHGPYPHYHGRVDVVTAPALRYAPDVSLQYRGTVPAPPHYFVNGDRAAVMLAPDSDARYILTHTPQGLPYQLQSYESILLLAPEGNAPVWMAAKEASRTVDVVVSHPLLAAEMREAMPQQARLHRADPRGFLARNRGATYDLIVFPMRGLFGGPSGLQALGGDMLFTVEGVSEAFAQLGENGWLAFPVWLDDPLRHSLRVVALVRAGLERQGAVAIAEHVVLLRGWGSVFIMASNSPVDARARSRAFAFAEAFGFDVIHPAVDGMAMRHGAEDEPPALWFRSLLGDDAATFLADYRFDVRPPTDARPFFNQFIRPGDWGSDLAWLSVSERGVVVMYVLLAQLVVAVVGIILLPLWPLRKQLTAGGGTVGYFGGLGAGFMLYEMALIQLLIPLWGDPVTGTAFVITTLLVGMSCGSALSAKLPVFWRDARLVTLAAFLVLMSLGVGLPALLRVVLPYGNVIRLAMLTPVLFISALLLGIPFPIGIRFLDRRASTQIPWACGIDGGMSVLAAPSAALLAFHVGYPAVVLFAAGAYLLSACAAHLGWKTTI